MVIGKLHHEDITPVKNPPSETSLLIKQNAGIDITAEEHGRRRVCPCGRSPKQEVTADYSLAHPTTGRDPCTTLD